MSAEVQEDNVVTELTKEMVLLMKMVVNTFYKAEDALVIDILIKHPCIREDDLIQLLKFDKKQTRASLDLLKKDKLIKSITKGDKEEVGPNGGILKSNYYFINYKVFINVVKYKIDRMRKKIEQDDKLTQDCQFHLCQECDLRFSDLDVRELYDLDTGTLRCKHCDSELVEDIQKIKSLQDRSMVSKFNEQTKVFTDLLRQTDNIKLADELLTPQPLKMKSSENRSRPVKLWQTNRKEYNLYQESSIKVNLDVDKESNKRQKKEMPIWLAKSTVVNEDPTDIDITNPTKQETAKITVLKDDYISQLIQNEVMTSSAPTSGSSSPAYDDVDREDEEEEEDTRKWLVSVGGQLISLTDIDEDHVARMTDAEKDLYNQKYREYCDSIMM